MAGMADMRVVQDAESLAIRSSPGALSSNRVCLVSIGSISLESTLRRIREVTKEENLHITDCRVAVTHDSALYAIAHGAILFIIPRAKRSKWTDAFGQVAITVKEEETPNSPTSPTPTGALQKRDHITDMCWVHTGAMAASVPSATATSTSTSTSSGEWLLVVGFSNGLIRLYRHTGQLLFTQRLQPGSVRRLRVRRGRSHRLVSSGIPATELLILYATDNSNGTTTRVEAIELNTRSIAWVEARSLASSVRDAIETAMSQSLSPSQVDAESLSSAADYPWSFRAFTPPSQHVSDIIPMDIDCDDPFGGVGGPTSSSGFVAAGVEPALAIYTPRDAIEEDSTGANRIGGGGGGRAHSTRGAIKLAASKITSAVFTMAKTWWHSDEPAADMDEIESLPSPDPLPPPDRCLRDSTRHGHSLYLAPDVPLPSGLGSTPEVESYLVMTDHFGRIALVERETLAIVRMWKGYRDAQCVLIRQHAGTITPTSTSNTANTTSAASSSSSSSSISSKPKKGRSKVSIVQQSPSAGIEFDEDDPFKDFDSLGSNVASSTASTVNTNLHHPTGSVVSSSPASLSTKVPTIVRASPRLFMLVYAPRRGQLELWALPFGGRIGAKNFGTAAGRSCTLIGGIVNNTTGETTAQIIRDDGRVQMVGIHPPTHGKEVTQPTQPIDIHEAEDEEVGAELERLILDWHHHHADECEGFACACDRSEFHFIESILSRLLDLMRARRVQPEAALPEEHAIRLFQHIRQWVPKLWLTVAGGTLVAAPPPSAGTAGSQSICPRLAEMLLESGLHLLHEISIFLYGTASPTLTELLVDDALFETRITVETNPAVTDEVKPTKDVRESGGWIIRGKSNTRVQLELLRHEMKVWLHLLAVYHASCAPGGMSTVIAIKPYHDLTLKQFLDCFQPRVAYLTPHSQTSNSNDKNKSVTNETGSTATAVVSAHLRFTLVDSLMSELTGAPHSSHPHPTLVAIASLLFGPPTLFPPSPSMTSAALTGTSATATAARVSYDYIAFKTLDMLEHLDAASIGRGLVMNLFLQYWWARLDSNGIDRMTHADAHTNSEITGGREQIQILLQTLITPPVAFASSPLHVLPPSAAALTLTPSLTLVLRKILTWLFHTTQLAHGSTLLRFARTILVKPVKEVYASQVKLHREKMLDGEYSHDDGARSVDAGGRLVTRKGAILESSLDFINMIDLSTRVIFRHLCQITLVRANFPQASLPDGILTLDSFTSSYPLSRLVAMHLLARSMNGPLPSTFSSIPSDVDDSLILSKDDLRMKLRSFESVLAAAGASDEDEPDRMKDTVQVATIQAVRARTANKDAKVDSNTVGREETMTIPISSWDWSLTSDDASVALYCSIQSMCRFLSTAPASSSSSAASSPALHNPVDLVRSIQYLATCPFAALTGGWAAWIWEELLQPHIRALVHVTYPNVHTPEAETQNVKSKPSAAAAAAAAAAASVASKKKSSSQLTFLKVLKNLYSIPPNLYPISGTSHEFLFDFGDLETLRTLIHCSQRTLTYLNACFEQEEKDLRWEGNSTYFCPAIAQTLDQSIRETIPIRQADHDARWSSMTAATAAATATPVDVASTVVPSLVRSFDRFIDMMVEPKDGPPPQTPTEAHTQTARCTSLFHTHVRYTHPEANVTYANIPSPLYARLTSLYSRSSDRLDRSLSDLLRLLDVLSSHIELDLNLDTLQGSAGSTTTVTTSTNASATSHTSIVGCTIAHMFPNHPLVEDSKLFKNIVPKLPHIFPTMIRSIVTNRKDTNINDVVTWIVDGTKWLDVIPTPAIPTSVKSTSTSNKSPSGSTNTILSLSPVPLLSARLTYLMTILRDRPSISTVPLVFSMVDTLGLDSACHESLLREHILLLYERGEDSRAWECVPRLDDSVCIASVLIGLGRTRLGLFLHALESKTPVRYTQLVSTVPAQAWQWLAKAQPPQVMSRRRKNNDDNHTDTTSTGGATVTHTVTPPVTQPPVYDLSGASSPSSAAVAFDPLHLILHRSIRIKQKDSDIDIHSTLMVLKRSKSMLDHALHGAPPFTGESFGKDGDNQDALRHTQPIRYARAYAGQLVEIAAMVVRGIGGRT